MSSCQGHEVIMIKISPDISLFFCCCNKATLQIAPEWNILWIYMSHSHRVWTLSLSCPQSPSIAGQTSCQRHRPGSWTTQLIGQGHASSCILCQRRLCKWTQNASWLYRWNLYPSVSSVVLCFTKSLEECLMLIALRPRNSQTFRQVLFSPNCKRNTLRLF